MPRSNNDTSNLSIRVDVLTAARLRKLARRRNETVDDTFIFLAERCLTPAPRVDRGKPKIFFGAEVSDTCEVQR